MTDEKVAELERLRRDNQELRGIITAMQVTAANAWIDLYHLKDNAKGRDIDEIRKVLDAWKELRGVRDLLYRRLAKAREELCECHFEESRGIEERMEALR